MQPFTLSLSERRALEKQIHGTKDTKVLKRAQALLWLTEGMSIPDIAKRLAVGFFLPQPVQSVFDHSPERSS